MVRLTVGSLPDEIPKCSFNIRISFPSMYKTSQVNCEMNKSWPEKEAGYCRYSTERSLPLFCFLINTSKQLLRYWHFLAIFPLFHECFLILSVITEINLVTSNLIHCKVCFCKNDSLYTPCHIAPLWHAAWLVSATAHIRIARGCPPSLVSIWRDTSREPRKQGHKQPGINLIQYLAFHAFQATSLSHLSQATAGSSVAHDLMPKPFPTKRKGHWV